MPEQVSVERRYLPQIGFFLAAVILFFASGFVTWARRTYGIPPEPLTSIVQLVFMLSPLFAGVIFVLFCALPIQITTSLRRMLLANRVALTAIGLLILVIAILAWFVRLMDALLLSGC